MGLLKSYRRWRHRRGFGVHSPSAFSFVGDVVRPARGYGYYAYPTLPRLGGGDNPLLLFRLVARIKPATVAILADTPQRLSDAAKIVSAANSSTIVDNCAPEVDLLLCLHHDSDTATTWRHAYFSDTRHPSLARRAAAATTGHLFKGRRHAIFVDSPAPFQTIDISL